MKKLHLLTTLLCSAFLFSASNAQAASSYDNALGLRGGLFSGVTFKTHVNDRDALELMVSTRWNGLMAGLLYEVHNDLADAEGLRWYYGGGGHVGFWDSSDVPFRPDGSAVVGVSGILGIEYNFKEIPLNISLDYMPSFNLIGYSGFWGDAAGLGARYTW